MATLTLGPLNADFDAVYLEDPRNPRWVAKPTVAYLWARTVRCKGCRATIPLLKDPRLAREKGQQTRLADDDDQLLTGTGVVFGIELMCLGQVATRTAARTR